MKNIVIIGGGAGGCSTALRLAKDHKVTIIEALPKLLSGSSDNTPVRLGCGFHYMDEETAIDYLRATFYFALKNKDFILHQSEEERANHSGRYFIVKDSLFDSEDILRLHKTLKNEYEKLVDNKRENEIFGPVGNFCRNLTVGDYKDSINCDRVIFGIDTAEKVLNWPAFKDDMIKKIKEHPNIIVKSGRTVTDINWDMQAVGYSITHTDTALETNTLRTHADLIVNASWHSIDELNRCVGIKMEPDSRTLRTKVMAEANLPKNYTKQFGSHNLFFCFGPHCSVTIVGNKAFITYEPVTNIESTTELTISKKSKRLITGGATPEEEKAFFDAILEGVLEYHPGMKGATLHKMHFGIVRTEGLVDIYDKKSDVHKRLGGDIKSKAPFFTTAPTRKLIMMDEVAKTVESQLQRQLRVHTELSDLVTELTTHAAKISATKILERKSLSRRTKSSLTAYEAQAHEQKRYSVDAHQLRGAQLPPAKRGRRSKSRSVVVSHELARATQKHDQYSIDRYDISTEKNVQHIVLYNLPDHAFHIALSHIRRHLSDKTLCPLTGKLVQGGQHLTITFMRKTKEDKPAFEFINLLDAAANPKIRSAVLKAPIPEAIVEKPFGRFFSHHAQYLINSGSTIDGGIDKTREIMQKTIRNKAGLFADLREYTEIKMSQKTSPKPIRPEPVVPAAPTTPLITYV